MNIPLKQVIKMDCLSNSVLVAGAGSVVEKTVKGITIMEAPDIADWIKGGELILTSLYSVYQDEKELESLVRKLSVNGAAGLVVKVGRFIEKVPEMVIRAGNTYKLPVLQIESDVKFVDIMYPIMNELFNRQLLLLEHYRNCHDRFMQLALQNGSIEDVARELKLIIHRPVIIFDRDFETLAFTDKFFSSIKRFEGGKQCFSQKLKGKCMIYRQQALLDNENQENVQLTVAPVSLFYQDRAFVGVLSGEEMAEIEGIAIETAVINVALELMKIKAVGEVEQKYQTELIDEIIHQRYQSVEEVRFRSQAMGWNLDQPYNIILLQIKDYQKQLMTEKGISDLKDQINRIQGIIKRIAMHYTKELIISSKSYHVLMLFPAREENSKSIVKFAKELHDSLEWEIKEINTGIGIGTVAYSIEEISKSYQEALDAIDFGEKMHETKSIVSYDDLGIYKILCKIGEINRLHKFIHPGLQKLFDYDQGRNNELIETLEVYLNHQGNAKKTAEHLFIHYKTVMYRIKRIKEIMGVDFEDQQIKLEIEVGLKILHMSGN